MGRIERINEQLRREISRIIHEDLTDPRFEFITVTHVDTSKDLRNAKVHYSVLGDDTQRDVSHKGLHNARGLIRKHIGKRVKMRCIPELMFCYDHSLEYREQIEEKLKEIHDHDSANH